jgi:hypothetical protein
MTWPHPPLSVLLEQLDTFWQHGLSVHALECVEAGLKVGNVELVRAAYRSTTASSNPVILEIAKGNSICVSCDRRSIL